MSKLTEERLNEIEAGLKRSYGHHSGIHGYDHRNDGSFMICSKSEAVALIAAARANAKLVEENSALISGMTELAERASAAVLEACRQRDAALAAAGVKP